MKKIAIAIDKWKLPIFKNAFDKAKVIFEKGPGVTPDTLLLSVNVEDDKVEDLADLTRKTEAKCQRKRHNAGRFN